MRGGRKYIKHGGYVGGKPSPELLAWNNMIRRCYVSTTRSYKYYKPKGIGVCYRWFSDFKNFLSDMGEKPDPSFSLDRIDNAGDYTPENCRWASDSVQMMNRDNCGTIEECKRGHARNAENFYMRGTIYKECKICREYLKSQKGE